jgi:hypothetical protein
LPKPQNFHKLRVIERYDGQSYRYSFAGRPEHRNELIVAQDHEVAIRVKGAIGGR